MRLYLDDDVASHILTRFLRAAGHDVRVPQDVGLSGRSDTVHLTHSVRESRVCLTRNYEDFESLHLLILQCTGHHPGILVIRRDDDPRRNLSPRDTVRALQRLEAAEVALDDQFYVLNHWR